MYSWKLALHIFNQKQGLPILLLLLTVSCLSSNDKLEEVAQVEPESQKQETLIEKSNSELDRVEEDNEVFYISGQTLLASGCGIDLDIQSKDADDKITDPCLDRGVSATVEITSLDNKLVSRLISDANGNFSVNLTAGQYTFVAKGNRFLGLARQTININGSQKIMLVIRSKIQVR